jgi:phosphoglycolate phosphatase
LKFAGALFDMDGTLLDTLADIADAMNGALVDMGCPVRTLEEYRFAIGDGIEMLARRVLPDEARDEGEVRRCVNRMKEMYRFNWAAKTRPYDGVCEMLGDLAARGVSLALLSNKPDEFAAQMVRHFFTAIPFRCAFGARPGIPRKPDPSVALEIARSLELEPEEVFYLGDTATDMLTALAAGMFPAAALWGFRPESELREAGAKALFAHPRDVLSYF